MILGVCSVCQQSGHKVRRVPVSIDPGDGDYFMDDPSETYVMDSHYPRGSNVACEGNGMTPQAVYEVEAKK